MRVLFFLRQIDSGELFPDSDHERIVFQTLAVCGGGEEELMGGGGHRQGEG
jgi:hypothetical protein